MALLYDKPVPLPYAEFLLCARLGCLPSQLAREPAGTVEQLFMFLEEEAKAAEFREKR